VLDEIVGYLCVPIFMFSSFSLWWHYLVAFMVFRILDAIKLPGARYVDKNIHNAHGVLFDDIISAVYTALVVSLVLL
jgi:phosphatidylglycerophosphatase A